jgi:diaminopimelate decarboxylase
MSLSRDSRGEATLGGLTLSGLIEARAIPTPAYVYDVDAIVGELVDLKKGFGEGDHLVCYAVKANSAGRILRRLGEAGAGCDVVSGGELSLCLAAGIPAGRIVWSGVAKQDHEIDLALGKQIRSIHVESVEELGRIAARARALGATARVSLRVNPSVEADTHAHIATGHDEAKFGVPIAEIGEALAQIDRHDSLSLVGLSAHIGSQMVSTEAYLTSVAALILLVKGLAPRSLELLDLGGGFGIDYGEGCAVRPADFIREARALVLEAGLGHLQLLCEPGRSLVASHGVLVARVVQEKRWKRPDTAGWLLLDAGMNDLLRPALYGARHRVEPLRIDPAASVARWRVAGPVCESSDDFGTFDLPDPPPAVVILRDAGAYGFTMASEYNGRALPAEAFLEQGALAAVHQPHSVDDWVRTRLG